MVFIQVIIIYIHIFLGMVLSQHLVQHIILGNECGFLLRTNILIHELFIVLFYVFWNIVIIIESKKCFDKKEKKVNKKYLLYYCY